MASVRPFRAVVLYVGLHMVRFMGAKMTKFDSLCRRRILLQHDEGRAARVRLEQLHFSTPYANGAVTSGVNDDTTG